MNEKVVKLVPHEVGDGYRFDPDEVLEKMKGEEFEKLLVIGMFADGSCQIEGNCNSSEAVFLMVRAAIELVGSNND